MRSSTRVDTPCVGAPAVAATVRDRWRAAAAANAHRPLLIWRGDGSVFSREDIDEALLRLQAALRRRGLGRGSTLLLRVPLGPESSALVLAAWLLGVRTMTAPPGVSEAWLDTVLRACPADLHVDSEDALSAIIADDAGEGAPADRAPQDAPQPDDDAAVVFSSGSTGPARAVVLSQRAVVESAQRAIRLHGLTPQDRVVTAAGLHTITGLRFSLLTPALSGGTSILLPPGTGFLDQLLRGVAEGGTVLNTVPAFARACLVAPDRARAVVRGSALRLIVVGGSALSPTEHAALADVLGVAVQHTYGLSESAGAFAQAWALPGEPAEIGLQPFECSIDIRGPDGAALPTGAVGQIWADTRCRFSRYLDATRNGAGPIFTGDLGHLDARGRLHVRGRQARMYIDPRGDNVLLDDVEAALHATAPLRGAFADQVPGTQLLGAIIEADDPSVLGQIRADLPARLPPNAVPHRWLQVAALPRGPNGKVDPVACRALLSDARA